MMQRPQSTTAPRAGSRFASWTHNRQSIGRATLAAVLATISLSGCGGGKEPTAPAGSGSVSFNYTGAVNGSPFSGTYDARGKVPTTGEVESREWAVGRKYVDGGELVSIVANTVTSEGSREVLRIYINGTAPHSGAICSDPGCPEVNFTMAFNSGVGFDAACTLESGTVALIEITTTRARGTFAGSGVCDSGTGGGLGTLTVSNGQFDVALEGSGNEGLDMPAVGTSGTYDLISVNGDPVPSVLSDNAQGKEEVLAGVLELGALNFSATLDMMSTYSGTITRDTVPVEGSYVGQRDRLTFNSDVLDIFPATRAGTKVTWYVNEFALVWQKRP